MVRTFEVSGGSQQALRSLNERRIIGVLSEQGEMTQAQIARRTSLAASTVSNIVSELFEQGVLERKKNLGGPHGQLIGLIPTPGAVAGIDLGKRHLTISLSNLAHEIIAEKQIDLPLGHGVGEDLKRIENLLDELCEHAGLDRSEVHTIGMAIPAPIDLEQRRISSAQVMPGWAEIDIPSTVEEALGIPTFIDNDANLGAIGERVWGIGQGYDNLVYIKVSDGIGAGLVLDGRIYRGADGAAGEIGHTTIDDRGELCRCGNRGCLETVVSVPAILKWASPIFGEDVTIAELIDQARSGNTGALRLLEDGGRYLGIALSNMVNILNPRVVILGGMLAEAGDILSQPIQTVLKRYAIHGAVENLEFKRAQLGIRSNVLGAVSLALEHTSIHFLNTIANK